MGNLEANHVWIVRRLLHPLNVIDSMKFLLSKMTNAKSNNRESPGSMAV